MGTKPGSKELFLGDPPNLPPEGNEIYEAEMKNGKWGPIKEHLRKGGHLDKFAFVPAGMVGRGLHGEKIPLKEFELKINRGNTEAVVFGASAEAYVGKHNLKTPSPTKNGSFRKLPPSKPTPKPGEPDTTEIIHTDYGYLVINRRFKDEAEGILLIRNLADILKIPSNEFREVKTGKLFS